MHRVQAYNRLCLRNLMVSVSLRELYDWRRPSREARTGEGSVASGLYSKLPVLEVGKALNSALRILPN